MSDKLAAGFVGFQIVHAGGRGIAHISHLLSPGLGEIESFVFRILNTDVCRVYDTLK